MAVFKTKIARHILAKRLESCVNKEMTQKMQTLLSGLESQHRKFDWKFDLSTHENRIAFNEVSRTASYAGNMTGAIEQLSNAGLNLQSSPLPRETCEHIMSVLRSTDLECLYSQDPHDESRWIITLHYPAEVLNPQAIISEHKELSLSTIDSSKEQLPTKELMIAIKTASDQLADNAEDFLSILKSAPPIISALAKKVDDLLIDMRNKQKVTKTETAMLSTVQLTNIFLNLFSKSSPEFFKVAFKKTPLGPIFIAAYQIVNEIFFATKWQTGRKEHLEAQFTTGERCLYFSECYKSVYKVMVARINDKIRQLEAIPGLDKSTITDLLTNENSHVLDNLTEDSKQQAQQLLGEIKDLSYSITEAKQATEALIKELREKSSRINTRQQILMATKHIDRIFNIVFIGLGIGAFFIPPLVIPAVILAVAKGLVRKKLEDRIRTGTEIVQGIYEVDNNIVVSKGNNNKAIQKSKNIRSMLLQYTPIAVVAINLGIRQNKSYERTQKLIRDNPEYTLYIPDSFSYRALEINATRREIRGQIDSFTMTCQQLIFHLGIIQGRQPNGELPSNTAAIPHPPYILNIDELKGLIDDWSENLKQQIRNQQDNSKAGKNSYFSNAQLNTIATLHEDVSYYIDAYQQQLAALDKKDGPEIEERYFDMQFAEKMHAAILDEITALKSVLNNKKSEQSVINAAAIKERLEGKIQAWSEYCKKCPNSLHQIKFETWQADFNYELRLLEVQMQRSAVHTSSPLPQQHIRDALSPPEGINPEISMGIDIEASGNEQLIMPVKHARYFESTNAFVSRLKEHVATRKELKGNSQKTELVLLPVAKVTKNVLFNFSGSYWKIMWLIRGIDRALESIEITLKNKDKIGVDINPKNLNSLLEFYKKQLKKIDSYRNDNKFTFSKPAQERVRKHIEQAIERTETLIEQVQPKKMIPSHRSQT